MASKLANEHVSTERSLHLARLPEPNIICILLIFALVTQVSLSGIGNAYGATPGLSPGMWAHYSLSGNETAGAVDALFTVQNINSENVTFSDQDTYADSHTSTDTVTVSILKGPTIPSSGEYFVISPDKRVGDLVYPDSTHYTSFPIQDITQRTYASARRATAHVLGSNSSTAYFGNNPGPKTYEDFYWDNPTGIFTEITKTLNNTVVLHAVMTSTSIWPPDKPLDPYIVPSAIISLTSAGLIGIIVVARYRKKPRRSH
jgi:hypothetical protein